MSSSPISNPAGRRIEALSRQLTSSFATAPPTAAATSSSSTSTSATMSTEKKPPITCHVLDTTIGRPASSIPVTLTLHNPPSTLSPNALKFSSTTNSDGRVTSWTPSSPFSSDGLDVVFRREGDQKYSLTFDTGRYFSERGIEAFFEEVEVRFVVREAQRGEGEGESEHFHVPVLLGPFGYTTYRGS